MDTIEAYPFARACSRGVTPSAVTDRPVGAGRDEQAHNLLMRGAAAPEHDRLEQRCPTEVVDVIDVDIGSLEQRPHHLHVAALGGGDQRCSPESVRERHIRPTHEHGVEDCDVARLAKGKEGVGQGIVADIDVGTRCHEGADGVGAPGVHRRRDSGATGSVSLVRVGTPGEQPRDSRRVTAGRSLDELPRSDGLGLIGTAG